MVSLQDWVRAVVARPVKMCLRHVCELSKGFSTGTIMRKVGFSGSLGMCVLVMRWMWVGGTIWLAGCACDVVHLCGAL